MKKYSLLLTCIATLHAKTESNYRHIPRNGYGIFTTVDALIWKAQQSGREFTRLTNTTNNTNNTLGLVAIQPCNSYNPGFRIGVGYTLPREHILWDLYGYYTQFNSSSTRSVAASDNKAPITTATLVATLQNRRVDNAASCWNLHFKNGDLEVGRKFEIYDKMRLRYHIGLRGTEIKEQQTITYTGLVVEDVNFSPLVTVHHNTFWGVGLQTGINTEIDLPTNRCWCHGEVSFYADASIALLSGKTKAFGSESHAGTLFADGCGTYGIMKAAFDLGAGLRWNRMFCDERLNFRVQLGWEQHYYPNIWIWVPSINTAGNGDFDLGGFTVSARLDF